MERSSILNCQSPHNSLDVYHLTAEKLLELQGLKKLNCPDDNTFHCCGEGKNDILVMCGHQVFFFYLEESLVLETMESCINISIISHSKMDKNGPNINLSDEELKCSTL